MCALAALATGEQHPLLTVIAEHSVALLAVVRAVVEDVRPPRHRPKPPHRAAGAADRPADGPTSRRRRSRGRYQHIPRSTVEE